ncbi:MULTISPECIES: SDR family NAD(P)-dependent oxidoreductase [Cyanophyceae]|uniref:SDR family NAD(P)-dependent oxidoreductase n=1 Tax=Leptolyngbya subtilissima DQ-A4 TaxID=2933933 RepID=A0ABV0KBN9_9CYAN|nr:SDR family NAD(P)-dependent oxidoreductase [Nodosilinea sp. FACHB-141]MBD2114105.1 SDR family NAD(P)-dependent oxidoreductase [Nodosilinea sp. FACHB-141]
MARLDGQVAVVTGATRGLGKGIATGLGEAGAVVYITGRTLTASTDSMGSLEETAAAVDQAGGTAIPVQVDHSDDDQVKALFDRIRTDQNGRLDLLVNNAYAGVSALKAAYGKPFWEADPAEFWDACNAVGLRSHYLASVHAARLMVPQRRGLICTLSSWGGLSYIFGVPYGVGKAACDRLAADMAVELKPHQVTSLSIWPGIVGTELMTQFAAEMGLGNSQPAGAGEDSSAPDHYNWETPLLTGRVIAALASDRNLLRRTGQVQIVAELAREYGAVDAEGNRPASLRSLRFVLPYAVPGLRPYAELVPDLELPWPFLLLGPLGSPKA